MTAYMKLRVSPVSIDCIQAVNVAYDAGLVRSKP